MDSPTTSNVLIIEDDCDTAESLRRVLEQRTDVKYAVEIVPTLKAAVARLKEGGIEAVLLDLFLSDGRGPEVIQRIKRASKDVGVVVVTGWAALEEPSKAAGADEFLVKPVDPAQVAKKLLFLLINLRNEKVKHAIEAPLSELGDMVMRLFENDAKKDAESSATRSAILEAAKSL